jgi:23S rRNA pseudouridine2605 synthase
MKTEQNDQLVRLNKIIAHRSEYSRREADKLIADGAIKVNGKLATDPATQVNESDIILVNGKKLAHKNAKYTIIAYHKPKGEIVSKKDPQGRKTIFDSLESAYKKFTPVGRLDYASEGLLLLTDSSLVADVLMNSDLERQYNIKIKGFVTPAIERAMVEGLELRDATAGAHSHTKIKSMKFAPFIGYRVIKNAPNFSRLSIILNEGQNREIRRFFAHFKSEVLDLKRVAYGFVHLNALPIGKTRFLNKTEYSKLHQFLKETPSDKKNITQDKA